jgi:hypothetical protein
LVPTFDEIESLFEELGIHTGFGSPNGVVTAPVGDLYRRKDGGASTTLYVKESGTGNTGWVAK